MTEAHDAHGQTKLAIDFDLLKQQLSDEIVEGAQERYTMSWPGKKAALLQAHKPINKTLRPARYESVNFDHTENLFIEGDNLEALKLLQEIYLGKVKMIYIDPPYNTGRDFIYKDNFTENTQDYKLRTEQKDEHDNRLVSNNETNGRFHSDWLSFMYPRLYLARNLLSEDGVIFISIDDNEQENLKKICCEIFGAENFIAEFAVQLNPRGRHLSSFIANNHEYILVIAKDAQQSHAICGLTKDSPMLAAYNQEERGGGGL